MFKDIESVQEQGEVIQTVADTAEKLNNGAQANVISRSSRRQATSLAAIWLDQLIFFLES